MRWMRSLAVVAVTCGMLFAQAENSSKAEALVKDAIAFAKKNGKAKLLEATSLPSGAFHLKKGDSFTCSSTT